ncbi:DUF2750 domain-containing protein [Pseudaeromonas sharmana]|uniref:DUF2750 domain-containing protein n=1 Tax=Pseudaeromonas sharmana TaxID=328412 RepID=A0ABV8CK11_9GAMM
MSHANLSAEQQALLALDADQRYDHFIQAVVAAGELWILRDAEGCMLLTADEDECIPVWPSAELAQLWAEQEWAGCQPEAISVKRWLDNWVKGMTEDGLAVAVFPLPEEIGVVEDPADVAEALLRQTAKQNRKK